MKKTKNYSIYYHHQNVTYKYIIIILYNIAHTSNGLNKRRYMEIREVIEEEDEDKNNNNGNKINNNIKIIKDDKNGENEMKRRFKRSNKFDMMYRSLAVSKEKNRNKININSSEKHDYITNENNFQNRPNYVFSQEKLILNPDNNSKINLPLLNIPTKISKKNKSNNHNNESPSTSAYTNSAKNNLKNDNNLTEQASKFRIGLFSANSLSNNGPIIPFLPIKRPVSNFNFGGNQLWETDEINDVKTKLNQVINNNDIDKISIEKNINNNMKKEIDIKNNNFFKNKNNKNNINMFKITDNKCKSVSTSNRNENLANNISNKLKSRLDKLRKEKGTFQGMFNIKLINDKKSSNIFNKNNHIFPIKNGNRNHSVKKSYMKV